MPWIESSHQIWIIQKHTATALQRSRLEEFGFLGNWSSSVSRHTGQGLGLGRACYFMDSSHQEHFGLSFRWGPDLFEAHRFIFYKKLIFFCCWFSTTAALQDFQVCWEARLKLGGSSDDVGCASTKHRAATWRLPTDLPLRMSACSNRFSQCCPSWSLVKPVGCWEWWQPPTAPSTSAFARMERNVATARDLPERWHSSFTMVYYKDHVVSGRRIPSPWCFQMIEINHFLSFFSPKEIHWRKFQQRKATALREVNLETWRSDALFCFLSTLPRSQMLGSCESFREVKKTSRTQKTEAKNTKTCCVLKYKAKNQSLVSWFFGGEIVSRVTDFRF